MKSKTPKERIRKLTKIRTSLPPSTWRIADYNPSQYEKENLKKWSIEQAGLITKGNSDTPCVIKDAEKIYDWVTK